MVSCLASFLSGCGEEDEGSKAPEQCKAFAEKWCKESLDCLIEVGTITEAERAENHDVCVDVAVAAGRCEDAVRVSDDYGACMAQLDTLDCQMFAGPVDMLNLMPPEVCKGVILVQ